MKRTLSKCKWPRNVFHLQVLLRVPTWTVGAVSIAELCCKAVQLLSHLNTHISRVCDLATLSGILKKANKTAEGRG
jgi:hypothetical protein